MARSKWESLLPASTTSNSSRSDLLGQLAAATAGGPSGSGTSDSLVTGLLQSSNAGVTEQLTSLTTQISSLSSIQQTQINALEDNTQAVAQNTTTKEGSGSSVASTVESAASSFLGGGLSLSPLISGLLSLFGGGSQAAAPPTPFTLPTPVQSEAGVTASAPGQVEPVSYGESGQPRAQSASSPTQVTIQVNAMDSQSFLDHSSEIAMAVKQAILNSNSLNDVISEL
jgi:hypothetical protein